MIINSINIKKFRGFKDVQFKLGQNLTVIAGQNGTQKTTLLGILSQPFTITDKDNPIQKEKPLSGGVFRSAFAEKFKLSPTFDTPKNHEWTLSLNRKTDSEFTLESIPRISRKSQNATLRFWQKGTRAQGSGYVQCPVIYLSLSRLFPIGEDKELNSSTAIDLNKDEIEFYQKWHNDILITTNLEITSVEYLVSKQKHTLGANATHYDWNTNSAGQDNIGKILLAILSFKRLKEKYPNNYEGGILVIDELDATLYPASQLKLVDALVKFSAKYNVQIIFTTHSLSILEHACTLQENKSRYGQVRVIYLQQVDMNVKAITDISFERIRDHLNVALSRVSKPKKIPVFTEDKEGRLFLKAILKQQLSTEFEFQNQALGYNNLIQLVKEKVYGFRFLQSIVILDGDAKIPQQGKCNNILLLPGSDSPERIIAQFLWKTLDESPIWDKIQPGYSKQFAFKDYTLNDILGNSEESKSREVAKKWFQSQSVYWGRNCARVITPWIKQNQSIVDNFVDNLKFLLNKYKINI